METQGCTLVCWDLDLFGCLKKKKNPLKMSTSLMIWFHFEFSSSELSSILLFLGFSQVQSQGWLDRLWNSSPPNNRLLPSSPCFSPSKKLEWPDQVPQCKEMRNSLSIPTPGLHGKLLDHFDLEETSSALGLIVTKSPVFQGKGFPLWNYYYYHTFWH